MSVHLLHDAFEHVNGTFQLHLSRIRSEIRSDTDKFYTYVLGVFQLTENWTENWTKTENHEWNEMKICLLRVTAALEISGFLETISLFNFFKAFFLQVSFISTFFQLCGMFDIIDFLFLGHHWWPYDGSVFFGCPSVRTSVCAFVSVHLFRCAF